MSSRRSVRQLLVAVLLGVLVGGGLMAVTPAGAEVSNAVATNWKKIWKKNLKPLADKRYYTKAASDAKYSSKAETAAGDAASAAAANAATDTKLGGYYKKTESDARYAAAGSGYTKTESDARYAAYPSLIRGSFFNSGEGTGSALASNGISFGVTFAATPTPHYIKTGDPVPAGCTGTPAAPNALPGNLCVFESTIIGSVGTNRGICNSSGSCVGAVDPFGASIYAQASGAGLFQVFGSWAARPGSIAPNPIAAARGGDTASPAGPGAAR